MATLLTTINSITFPYELDQLDFATYSGGESFKVEIKVEGVAIYTATLTTNEDAEVSLYALADLLNAYLVDEPMSVHICLDGVIKAATSCFPCGVRMDTDAQSFFEAHFLSRAKGAIETYPGCTEYCTFADGMGDYPTLIEANFATAIGYQKKSITGSIRMEQNEYLCSFDVEVDKVAAVLPDAVLCDFTVTIGNRKQKFVVRSRQKEGMHLTFRNTFGAIEHIYFPMVEMKMSPTISAAHINGVLTNYKTEPKKIWTGTAEWQLPSMVEIFEDFLSSKTISRQSTNTLMTIESGEVNDTTLLQGGASAKASWREAKKMPSHFPTRRVRTFDATFDNTFE